MFTFHLPGPMPADPVEQRADGRWFVVMGFAGFNSRANNTSGFATRAAAVRSIVAHQARGRRARGEA